MASNDRQEGTMTYPTIKGSTWVLMRWKDPVPVQNYGKITRALADEKARKYANATPGHYELVRIEHVERETERFPVYRDS